MMNRLEDLKRQKRQIEADIDEENRQQVHAAHASGMVRGGTPKWDAMTPEQQRHCQFMGFDPDNPDVPLD